VIGRALLAADFHGGTARISTENCLGISLFGLANAVTKTNLFFWGTASRFATLWRPERLS